MGLCFIDGGHDYETVRHDFAAALAVAAPGCAFLLDDYTARRGYGVRRFVDGEVRPRVPHPAVEIVDGLSRDRTVYGEDVAHELALLRGEFVGERPLQQFFSPLAARRARVSARARHLARRVSAPVRAAVRGLRARP